MYMQGGTYMQLMVTSPSIPAGGSSLPKRWLGLSPRWWAR